jgi:methylenetetrahydrofolate reductase (NADPH)
VTASPAKGLDATLDLTVRLAGRGYHVVPHVSARLVTDGAHLADIVARLTACGVDDVFVPAGDADPPAGEFDSALSLLERLAEMGNPFPRTGITGYPESHPRIEDDITVQAMWDKRRHASYIVSNLCFDPGLLRRWINRVRARGVTLPLYVGLAGPLERARLLRMAAKAGAADSARFLAGHTEWFLRLGTPGGYSPERLLSRLAPTLSSPEANVEGLHLFTFNQVQQTEQWRQALLARLG